MCRLLIFVLSLALLLCCDARCHAQSRPTASARQQANFDVRSHDLPADLQLARDLIFQRHPSRNLRLHLLRPRALPRGPLPVVIYVHGGAWNTGTPDVLPPLAFELARRGFALAAVEFRSVSEAPFPAPLDDLRLAVRWLRVNAPSYSLDATKIGAYGTSSGGHLAALLAFTGSSVKALALESAPSDLATLHVGSRVKWNTPSSPIFELLGATPAQKPDLARRASPLFFADEFAPPTLILHGGADSFVPPAQSEKLFGALQKAKAPVSYVLFADEEHGLRNVRADADARIAAFFERHLRASPPRKR